MYIPVVIICFVVFFKYNMVSLLFQRSLVNSDVGTASSMVIILYLCIVCIAFIIKGIGGVASDGKSIRRD